MTQKARLEEVSRKLKKEDRNIETARLYLESHGWDVQAALKGYKEGLRGDGGTERDLFEGSGLPTPQQEGKG
jgi:hypothetical protein